MATEKILIFDEAGNAKRMKVRIARFLDNEPVTASDKENIRTTLDVDDSLSGTFTTPLSVTSASDSSFTGGGKVGIGTDSPQSNLHVYSSTADNLRLERDATNDWRIQLTGGALAFRDATADLERLRIDSSGRVGIGLTPSYALHVSGDIRNDAAVFLNDGKAVQWGGTDARIVGSSGGDYLRFYTAGLERWTINSTGNLVAGSGLGIDFGSAAAAGRTVESGLLSDYEIGTWSPVYSTSAAAMTTPPTMDIIHARYVKVGGLVHLQAYIRTDSVDTSGGSGNLMITGLPFAPHTGSYSSVDVSLATDWGTDFPLGGYMYPTGITLLKRSSVNGATSNMSVTDLTNGATSNQNRLIFNAAYYTSA